jgi:endonuclease/exonuclease/phosphatase family metal-dependent hydrolase
MLDRVAMGLDVLARVWRVLKWGVISACWVGSLAAISIMTVMHQNAEAVTLLAVCNYLPVSVWLLPLIGMAAGALVFHRLSMLPVAVASLVWWFVFLGWGGQSDFTEDEIALRSLNPDTLRLVTCNRGQGQGHSLRPFLGQVGPDLIALQDSRGKADYYRRTPAYAEYRYVEEEGEFVILSKFPVIGTQPIIGLPLPSTTGGGAAIGCRCEVDWKGVTIAVYNVHLPSPRRYLTSPGLSRVASEVVHLVSGDDGILDEYWGWRVETAEVLAGLLARERMPWLVLGDLNTPPRGRVYRGFTSVGTDLHEGCGQGLGFTFPGTTRNPFAMGKPWLRLDYIVASPRRWTGNWQLVEPMGRGQHRAVAAEIQFLRSSGS